VWSFTDCILATLNVNDDDDVKLPLLWLAPMEPTSPEIRDARLSLPASKSHQKTHLFKFFDGGVHMRPGVCITFLGAI